MLAIARRCTPGAEFVAAEASRLPFGDEQFDLVLAVTMMCFVAPAARQAAIEEMVRVTRLGGRVVLGELAPWSIWAIARRIRGRLGASPWNAARFTSRAELRHRLQAAGALTGPARYGLYLPPLQVRALTDHASGIERACRHLGPVGAALVVVGARRPAPVAANERSRR